MAAPPSPQEVHRKLSLHTNGRPSKNANAGASGAESDSDSAMSPDLGSLQAQPPPLSVIQENRDVSGEDSEEDDILPQGVQTPVRRADDEGMIKAGYLLKKGERRKTWKKRWFVLRPSHIAVYKTNAEYRLLRLIDLGDIHSCQSCQLKNHANTFGLVSPARTYYLQAGSASEVNQWVEAVSRAKEALMATSTTSSGSGAQAATAPIPIPIVSHSGNATSPTRPAGFGPQSMSLTSSESDEPSSIAFSASPTNHVHGASASVSTQGISVRSSPMSKASAAAKDPSKVILSGYLMKCGSKRKNWRKRWFVLSGEKLMYTANHMDGKHHKVFPFSDVLDALEYDLPTKSHREHSTSAPIASPPHQQTSSMSDDADGGTGKNTFKIVTTQRTLLLCAPTEEEEIKWLSAVRALIHRQRSGSGDHGAKPGNIGAAGATVVVGANPKVTSSSSGEAGGVTIISGAGAVGGGSASSNATPGSPSAPTANTSTSTASSGGAVSVGGGGLRSKIRRPSFNAGGHIGPSFTSPTIPEEQ